MRIVCAMGFHDWELDFVMVGRGTSRYLCHRCGKCKFEYGDFRTLLEETRYRRKKKRSNGGPR